MFLRPLWSAPLSNRKAAVKAAATAAALAAAAAAAAGRFSPTGHIGMAI